MTIQKRIQAWLGITQIMNESLLTGGDLRNYAAKIQAFEKDFAALKRANSEAVQEMRNLFQRISQKFDNVTPASPEFFDEMRKQMEARMDQTMNACERLRPYGR